MKLKAMEIIMRKLIKLPGISALVALILFSMAGCSDGLNDATSAAKQNQITETTYLGKKTLAISGKQTWTRNRYATKISQAYLKYEGNHVIDVAVPMAYNPLYIPGIPEDPYTNPRLISALVGSGDIRKGIISFNTNDLVESKHLVDWPDFRLFFSRYWNDVFTSDLTVKGNTIALYAYPESTSYTVDGMLDRQRITGSATTITCETVLYFYVDKDCTITGKANSNYIAGLYYFTTEGDLYLPLKAGWNIVSRTETYGTNYNGHARIGMKLKNPLQNAEKFKWTMELGFTGL